MIYTYKNFAEAKLASQLNSGDSTMIVTTASTLPTTGTFIAVIWNAQLFADAGKDPDVEIVLATLSSGYTYNLTRARESTTASTHVVGCTVGLYLTAAAFADLVGATGPQGPQGDPGPTHSQIFLSSGTFTAPAGVTLIFITGVAPGGGGGGYDGSQHYGGSGAGSGAYCFRSPYIVTPAGQYTVTIGTKGTGGATSANGTDAGNSSFGSYTLVGGKKGSAGANHATGGAGGTATAISYIPSGSTPGGVAYAGISSTAGTAGADSSTYTAGAGAGSPFGYGGAGDSNSCSGTGFGSGGGSGGQNTHHAGGDGAPSFILVEW